MPSYDLQLQRTAGGAVSVGNVTAPGSGMRRAWIWDIILGCEGAAADNVFKWQIQRCTTAGTRTGVTPSLRDSADVAAVTTAGQNHTVEPTYTAGLIARNIPLNQRATFRWQVDPRDGLCIPATANNGYGFLTPTFSALAVTADLAFVE